MLFIIIIVQSSNLQVLEECSSAPCQNGGICINQEGLTGFYCQCPTGFEGPTCEVNIDDCLGVVCPPHSECMDGVSEYTCQCHVGFAGKLCLTVYYRHAYVIMYVII